MYSSSCCCCSICCCCCNYCCCSCSICCCCCSCCCCTCCCCCCKSSTRVVVMNGAAGTSTRYRIQPNWLRPVVCRCRCRCRCRYACRCSCLCRCRCRCRRRCLCRCRCRCSLLSLLPPGVCQNFTIADPPVIGVHQQTSSGDAACIAAEKKGLVIEFARPPHRPVLNQRHHRDRSAESLLPPLGPQHLRRLQRHLLQFLRC